MKYIILFIICGLIFGFTWPLFLVFIGAFVVYWVMTAKKRRARIMFNHIYALVASGEPFIVINDIYFEAALKFALEHGARLEPGVPEMFAEKIGLSINIGGTNYLIHISRYSKTQTWLSAINMDEEKRKFRERLGIG